MVSQYSSESLYFSIIHVDNRPEKEPKLIGYFPMLEPECSGENLRAFVKEESSFPLKLEQGSEPRLTKTKR